MDAPAATISDTSWIPAGEAPAIFSLLGDLNLFAPCGVWKPFEGLRLIGVARTRSFAATCDDATLAESSPTTSAPGSSAKAKPSSGMSHTSSSAGFGGNKFVSKKPVCSNNWYNEIALGPHFKMALRSDQFCSNVHCMAVSLVRPGGKSTCDGICGLS